MIGLVISLAIQAVGLMIAVTIILVRLLIRLGILIASGVASLIANQRASSPPANVAIRGPLDPNLRWSVFRRDGYTCVGCGATSDLTVDHIHPVSLGGGDDQSNLQTLCRSCNSSKGAW